MSTSLVTRFSGVVLLAVLASPTYAGPPGLDVLAEAAVEERDEFAEDFPDRALVIGIVEHGQRRILATGSLPDGADVDGQTLFEIGSITKTLTGFALASAVTDNVVRLDQTVGEFMPEDVVLDDTVAAITLEQLATHTSGLPRIAPTTLLKGIFSTTPYGGSRETLNWNLSLLGASPTEHPEYSNLGVGLLGDILSRIEGKPFEDVVRNRVTRPLGLTDTVATLSETQKPRFAVGHLGKSATKPWSKMGTGTPAGGFRSTVDDLLTYAEAVIDPASPIASIVPLATDSRVAYENGKRSVGLCWHRLESPDQPTIVMHNGATYGHRSTLFISPERQRAVVILMNATSDRSLPNIDKLARKLVEQEQEAEHEQK